MINGAHSIIYSKDPEADRAFLRDVLRLPSVEVGDGGKLGIYEPRHPRPKAMKVRKTGLKAPPRGRKKQARPTASKPRRR